MSRTDLQGVVDALCTVQRGVPWPGMGICDNVENLLMGEDGYELTGFIAWADNCLQAFRQWDKFSGVSVYPVHDTSAPGTPSTQFQDHCETETLWEGVQGELRQDLLDHLIKYFTDRLEEETV